ncbi:MAG: ankyrin repeat domain-containing protein [Verrucomicrobia bacterium]|nr:ankyrin repeat domain-containing protein [Verrucomicrobiota bacterium]
MMTAWAVPDPMAACFETALHFFAAATLKGTMLLMLAGLLSLGLQRSSAAVRHALWSLTLVGLLLLPLLTALLPAWRVPVLPSMPVVEQHVERLLHFSSAAHVPATSASDASASFHAAARLGSVPQDTLMRRWFSPITPAMWTLLAWGGGVLAVAASWLTGAIGIARLRGTARLIDDAVWNRLLRNLSVEVGLKRTVTLIESDQPVMPMTWGVFYPVILLPAERIRWSEEQRRLILLHELVHIQRLDHLTQWMARMACAIYWFHPLVWMAAGRLRIEREQACDNRVLSGGTKGSDYASLLLHMAERQFRFGLSDAPAALPMTGRGQLEARLRALLDGRRSRDSLSWLGWGMACVVALCLCASLAVLRPVAPVGVAVANASSMETREWPETDRTPMMAAVMHRDAAEVAALLKRGANPNERRRDGATLLMIAAQRGSTDLVRILLENGADIHAGTAGGETALFRASKAGKTDVVKVLLERGADVNAKTAGGLTALIPAIRGGHTETALALLHHGADANAREEPQGDTAFAAAARGGQLDLARALIAAGADVNARDRSGYTPLMTADVLGHAEIVNTLLAHGVDVNAKAGDGFTALLGAAAALRSEAVKSLLERGADVNARDEEGWTPLMMPAMRGQKEMVAMLLSKGADVNARTRDGRSALSLATEQGGGEIAAMLKQAGARG